MKRLIKICFDTTIFSFVPILSWIALGLLVESNLINVFTLTYPFQFLYLVLKSIFAVGPNIYMEKHHDKNAVMSSMILGVIVGFFIFGFIIFNIDKYIMFMNMEVSIYHNFALYSVFQLYIQLIFSFILQKLYYENRNNLANKYTIIFNLLNFIVLMTSSILFKSQIVIILITLISISLYVAYILIKEFNRFSFSFHLFSFIKYDCVDIYDNIFFFIIYLFGISNVISFGNDYMMAMNFITLITDMQWDGFDSISTVAKIDISRGCFNYKQHRKNAYKLLIILLMSILVLFITMFSYNELNIKLVLIYLLFELVLFLIYPIYRIKICFLQLEYSSFITTSNRSITSVLRTLLSFLPTPFCTSIGQLVSSVYQFTAINTLFHINYKIAKSGVVKNKNSNFD